MQGWGRASASIHESGQVHRGGRITKQGRRERRTVMIEGAWVAVEHHPYWNAQFDRLAARLGKQKAMVAVARKLLVAIWPVLTKREADDQGDTQAVARKLLTWLSRCGRLPGQYRSRRRLLRQRLDQLGINVDTATYLGGESHLPRGEPVPVRE